MYHLSEMHPPFEMVLLSESSSSAAGWGGEGWRAGQRLAAARVHSTIPSQTHLEQMNESSGQNYTRSKELCDLKHDCSPPPPDRQPPRPVTNLPTKNASPTHSRERCA